MNKCDKEACILENFECEATQVEDLIQGSKETDLGEASEHSGTAMENESSRGLVEERDPEDRKTAPASHRLKLLITVFCYWNVMTIGLLYAQMGPVLPDLQLITNSSLQDVTWLFTGVGIGNIVGCLILGIVPKQSDQRLQLFLSTSVTGLTVCVLPWIDIIYVSIGTRVIHGISLVWQDGVNLAIIFGIWREKSGPFNQWYTFFYSVGCFLSPLYTKPFLRKVEDESFAISSNISFNASASAKNGDPYGADTRVHYSFVISAVASFSAALPFLLMYICKVEDPAAPSSDLQDEHNKALLPVNLMHVVLGLSVIVSFFIYPTNDFFPYFLTEFVLNQLSWTQQNAASLTATFYAMSGIGCVLGFFALKYSTLNKLMIFSYTGAAVGVIGCVIGSVLKETSVIWIAVTITGVCLSSTVSIMYTWIEENITHLTVRIASLPLLSGSIGLSLEPILLGYLMENHGPMWLLYIILGGIIVCSI